MSDIVDAAAEAIWRADRPSEAIYSWDECIYANTYRRMAQAAIDALGLTQQHRIMWAAACAMAPLKHGDQLPTEARWVTPWVQS